MDRFNDYASVFNADTLANALSTTAPAGVYEPDTGNVMNLRNADTMLSQVDLVHGDSEIGDNKEVLANCHSEFARTG